MIISEVYLCCKALVTVQYEKVLEQLGYLKQTNGAGISRFLFLGVLPATHFQSSGFHLEYSS